MSEMKRIIAGVPFSMTITRWRENASYQREVEIVVEGGDPVWRRTWTCSIDPRLDRHQADAVEERAWREVEEAIVSPSGSEFSTNVNRELRRWRERAGLAADVRATPLVTEEKP